jgi:hypothetical protein
MKVYELFPLFVLGRHPFYAVPHTPCTHVSSPSFGHRHGTNRVDVKHTMVVRTLAILYILILFHSTNEWR